MRPDDVLVMGAEGVIRVHGSSPLYVPAPSYQDVEHISQEQIDYFHSQMCGGMPQETPMHVPNNRPYEPVQKPSYSELQDLAESRRLELLGRPQLPEITDPDQLEVGAWYQCYPREGSGSKKITMHQCDADSAHALKGIPDGTPLTFLGDNRIWAYPGNNQAFQRWRIFGPVPFMTELPPEPEVRKAERKVERWDCIECTGRRLWVIAITADEYRVVDPRDDESYRVFRQHQHLITIGPNIRDADKAMAWCRGEYDPKTAPAHYRAAESDLDKWAEACERSREPTKRPVSIKDLRKRLDGIEELASSVGASRMGGEINRLLADWPEEKDQISDGYHTFRELYDHRMTLFVMLQWALAQGPAYAPWWSRQHHEGGEPMFEGMVIAGVRLPTGQITYHLNAERYAPLLIAAGIIEWPRAPRWDEHTSADVLNRMQQFLMGHAG